MMFGEPVVGLVVRYDFLWSHEAARGQIVGTDRPAVVGVLVSSSEPGIVGYLPITHSPPAPHHISVEIPPSEKQRLGLDDLPSWIIVSEINLDRWPKGLSPTARTSRAAYGRLSRGLAGIVLARLSDGLKKRQINVTRRS